MSQAVRKLSPGEVVIGFIHPEGTLIGELVDAQIGHEELSYRAESLRSKLASGLAIAITIGKRDDGTVKVLGSGAFPPLGGGPLSNTLRNLAATLVE